MLDLLKFVRDTLKDDATIKSYLGDPARIYLAYKPVIDSAGDSYPQITMNTTDGATDSVCNTCDPALSIDIWSKNSPGVGGATTAKLIAKRIYQLLDPTSDLVSSIKIYQIWKNSSTLIYEDDTEVWHHSILFNVQMDGYSKT
jgi:hypothetical protein